MKDTGIKRLYYSISEVSRLADEEPYVLRYWETEFEQLRPQKNRAGNRIYAPKDIEVIKAIKHLLRDKRYTIEGAKEMMKEYRPDMVASELHAREDGGFLANELDDTAHDDTPYEGVIHEKEAASGTGDSREEVEAAFSPIAGLASPTKISVAADSRPPQHAPDRSVENLPALQSAAALGVESLNGVLAKPTLTREDLFVLRDTLRELLQILS